MFNNWRTFLNQSPAGGNSVLSSAPAAVAGIAQTGWLVFVTALETAEPSSGAGGSRVWIGSYFLLVFFYFVSVFLFLETFIL